MKNNTINNINISTTAPTPIINSSLLFDLLDGEDDGEDDGEGWGEGWGLGLGLGWDWGCG